MFKRFVGIRQVNWLGRRFNSTGEFSFASVVNNSRGGNVNGNENEIANISSPRDSGRVKGKPHEVPIKYVLNCVFRKNNTHFTYSAVVEDKNFLENNPELSYNEKFLYYLRLPQKVKFAISTGCLGFRKALRGEYEAAFQTTAKVFQMIKEKGMMNKDIEIVIDDFGKGRSAFMAALNGKEGNEIRKRVTRISDKTALKFGGVRSPRIRRL
ncbi:Small ribosomal subunit protein uS11m [Nakaseomyces bracarensis]|uniref:Small ribosomal subunit protein uS11m n=1 Tax=Nakaseomyces bracarensis TaxID=273131 RepID=A0ABR4NWP9_9SACH